MLESYESIFFSAVQISFHFCSFLLFKLFGEVTCKPDCPHSLTLKPCEHLAGTVLVPQPTAAEPQTLVSVQRRQRHPMFRKYANQIVGTAKPAARPCRDHQWTQYCETQAAAQARFYHNI